MSWQHLIQAVFIESCLFRFNSVNIFLMVFFLPYAAGHLYCEGTSTFFYSVCICCIFCRATINQVEMSEMSGWLRVHSVCPDTHTVAPDTASTRSNYQPGCYKPRFRLALAQHRSRWQKCNQRCLITLHWCRWKLWRASRKRSLVPPTSPPAFQPTDHWFAVMLWPQL